jgi:hypothetical protein
MCHLIQFIWFSSNCKTLVGGISSSALTLEFMYWCRSIRSSAFCCWRASVSVISVAREVRVSLKKRGGVKCLKFFQEERKVKDNNYILHLVPVWEFIT